MTRFYINEKLGPTRGLTPEGFLVIRDAVLARTGPQLYSEKEVPIKGDSSGRVIIGRDEDQVFAADTIASLNGKPVAIDHPSEDVTPRNWKEHFVGVVMYPRRGEGVLDNLLLGDLMVYDPDAIEEINSGNIRELSVGYDANYFEDSPGHGHQENIIANHLALVAEGRCGPVCRIGDSARRSTTRDSRVLPTRRKPKHIHLHY